MQIGAEMTALSYARAAVQKHAGFSLEFKVRLNFQYRHAEFVFGTVCRELAERRRFVGLDRILAEAVVRLNMSAFNEQFLHFLFERHGDNHVEELLPVYQ